MSKTEPISIKQFAKCLDFSKIEARILANNKPFKPKDIFVERVCKEFGVSSEEMTSTMRRVQKTVSFHELYGVPTDDNKDQLRDVQPSLPQIKRDYLFQTTGFDPVMNDLRRKGNKP
jgi:hypothetical protein